MGSVGDNPIKKSAEDRLERRAVAGGLARDIREADATEGYVLGVVGAWGSGKTSIINMAREYLAEEPALVTIDFNPWVFSGTNDLVQAFFREIAAQMKTKGERLADIAETIYTYSDILTPITLVPFVGGWFERMRGASKAYAELMAKRKGGVNEQRTRVSEQLGKLEAPIVVVIDDIDRLESSEIRDIFKLVRLTASFPNIIYLLAFDRERVEEALTQSGFDGRAYLEKIIQLGSDVPPVADSVLLRQIGEALEGALNDLDIPERFNEDAWPDVLMEIIRPLIRNMRDIKRFAAAVRSKAQTLNGQVEMVDLMGLESVRLFLPDVFRAIVEGREGLTTPSDGTGSQYENPMFKQQVLHIVEVGEKRPDLVRATIERLFPAGVRHIENNNYGASWSKTWLKARRVAHPDVLAVYLENVANENMQAFDLAEQAFSILSDEKELSKLLRSYDIKKLQDVIAALEAFEDDYPVEAVVPATKVLLNLLPDLPERPRGVMTFIDTRLVVTRVVLRLVRRLKSHENVTEAINEVIPAVKSLSSRFELVTLVGYLEGAGHKLVSEEDAKALEQDLKAAIQAATPNDLAKERDLLRLLYAPKHWDEDGETIKVDPNQKKLAQAVLLDARSVAQSQGMGTRAVRRTTQLHWDVLVEIFDGEDNVKRAVDKLRKTDDRELLEVIQIADRYLTGWRPSRWGDDDD